MQLLEAVHEVEGIERIRFTSPHPIGYRDDLDRRLHLSAETLLAHPFPDAERLGPHPASEMRRPYKNEKFVEICEKMKAARPGIAITTDIIVGFPGETEEDFQATIDTVERLQVRQRLRLPLLEAPQHPGRRNGRPACPNRRRKTATSACWPWSTASPSPATPRSSAPASRCSAKARPRPTPPASSGRTSQNKIVIFDGDADRLTGQILDIQIEESSGFTLFGTACLTE